MKRSHSLSLVLALAACAFAHPVFAHGSPCAKPFQYSGSVYFPVGYSGVTGEFVAPAGYRLQVEYVSAGFRMTTNDGRASFSLGTTAGSVFAWHRLSTEVGYALSDRMARGPVSLYADPNTLVKVSFNRASGYTVGTYGTYAVTGCLYPI